MPIHSKRRQLRISTISGFFKLFSDTLIRPGTIWHDAWCLTTCLRKACSNRRYQPCGSCLHIHGQVGHVTRRSGVFAKHLVEEQAATRLSKTIVARLSESYFPKHSYDSDSRVTFPTACYAAAPRALQNTNDTSGTNVRLHLLYSCHSWLSHTATGPAHFEPALPQRPSFATRLNLRRLRRF